ncbi:MAG TPA: tetratricopeptide repeat protein [Ktedonobacteraceae bacterium]|nr:tetratricopeptide repeat protein [Ktedonobacteraceae bacterium]
MTQTTLREYLRTTEDAISSGRIEEAMANCQNILTYFPEALEAQRLLGEVYLAQGQMEEAQQTFEWILTNDPENVIVYCDRALISERTSDIDTALDCYQQAYELSRGNANIRQEFNQLSTRAGQQEFMFSRAGLARLYMRGDLLTQAIQEWDAVLAISPDRLDARLGLMETYWRDGNYTKAEQIGTQLLGEVPTCLKALLFMAHIASIANIGRARDLLIRAQALDPELTMAQELFADLAASQPNDPFLELLKKEPILLEDGRPVTARNASAPQQPAQPAPVENTYGNWDQLDRWDQPSPAGTSGSLPGLASGTNGTNGTNGSQPDWQASAGEFQTYNPSLPEMPTASWVSQLEQQAPSAQEQPDWYQQSSGESWSGDIQEEEKNSPPAWLDTLTRGEQTSAPLNTAASSFQEAAPVQPSSPEHKILPAPAQSTPEIKAQPQPEESADDPMPFFFPTEDDNEGEMGWPEWLKSLGAEELEPEQAAAPSAPLPEVAPAPASLPVAEQPLREAPQPDLPEPEADPWASLPSLSAHNDARADASSQPDWMQQMSPIELSSAPGPAPDWMQQISPISDSPQSAPPDWMQQFSPASDAASNAAPAWMQQFSPSNDAGAQNTAPDWMQQFSPANNPAPQSAAPDWMQQFSPAQTQHGAESSTPDWMQQLSSGEPSYQEPALPAGAPVNEQEQRYLASLEDLEKSLQAQGFVPMEPGSLSSLAQAQTSVPAQPQQENQPSLSSALAQLGNLTQQPQAPASASTNDTWWNSQNNPASVPDIPHTPSEALNPFAALGARTNEETVHPFAPLPATPTPEANPGLTPTYRSDALLDSDLETTMKRPAITLQPMKPGDARQDRPNGKGRSNVSRPLETHVDDGNLSNHERLIRGYQYQLSGAYEEAMQEYRLIIRNAPELLEDVISNLRALLKINPRFSLGYRVLGDAYMRKGEYLQAMESYNKALTMAKKAKN